MAFKDKSKALINHTNKVAEELFGRTLSDSLKQHICVMCGEPVNKLKNDLLKQKYNISGLCDNCQAKVFFSKT